MHAMLTNSLPSFPKYLKNVLFIIPLWVQGPHFVQIYTNGLSYLHSGKRNFTIANFAPWVILHAALSTADFFKIGFLKKSYRNTFRVSNSLDLGQTQRPTCQV